MDQRELTFLNVDPETGVETGWRTVVTLNDAGNATQTRVERVDGRFFHNEMTRNAVVKPDGSLSTYWQPMTFEHPRGEEKIIGEVVTEFVLDPKSNRYLIWTEPDVAINGDGQFVHLDRAARSSVDNPKQAATRRVKASSKVVGLMRLNTKRIAGYPVRCLSRFVNYHPSQKERLRDLRDHVLKSQDTPGIAGICLTLASPETPDDIANEIFQTLRGK